MAVGTEPGDGGAADAGEVDRGGPRAQTAAVFAERHVANIEDAVLDRPVAAIEGQQFCGVGLFARQTRQTVNDFSRGPLFASRAVGPSHLARDLKGLSDAGPAQFLYEIVQRGGADERADFAAAMALIRGLRGLPLGLTLPPLMRGKKPPQRR